MIVKFVLCVLFLRTVSGELLLPLINESGDSVTRVIGRIFDINETVAIITDGIMSDVEFEIPNPKIIWNFNVPQILAKYQTVYNYIILVNDSNSLGKALDRFYYSSFWPSQNIRSGTFLIIISKIDQVFETLWNYHITNSVILVNGNGSSNCKLYQSIRWSLENQCGEWPNVTREEDCQDGPTLTFKKGFRSYHGCPINYWTPITNIFINATLTELTKRYGVSLTISYPDSIKYTAAYAYLQSDNQLTSGVEFKHYVWLMPLPKQVPPLKLYLIIFQGEVWIMVAVGFLLTILFYIIILRRKRIHVNLSTFGFIIMEILSLTFWGCCSRIPNVTSLRVLLLSYIFYAIVVQTGYVSNLVRVQTIPHFEPGIDSIRELIKSDIPVYWTALTYGTDHIVHSLFKNAKKDVVRLLDDQYNETLSSIIVDNKQGGAIMLHDIAISVIRKHKIIHNKLILDDSILPTKNSIIVDNNQGGAIMLHDIAISVINKHKIIHNKLILDDSILPTKKFVFTMPPEHYFFDFFNKVVIGFAENGIYAHLNGKEDELLKNAVESINYPTDPQVLTLDHVYGIFVIWGFGLGISFLVFILEIIVHKLQVSKSTPIAVTVTVEEEVEVTEIEYIA
ncbi:hypothetical protein RI129_004194 [Pyrocoelia pectoralis]|uniref:Ionotropic glutamate receptor C-terminal domain-containing protein n=1 Tax=Pyrocoelia pectoralis TaxID=417401 RepID=A0AAN7VBV3_9COLE